MNMPPEIWASKHATEQSWAFPRPHHDPNAVLYVRSDTMTDLIKSVIELAVRKELVESLVDEIPDLIASCLGSQNLVPEDGFHTGGVVKTAPRRVGETASEMVVRPEKDAP